MHIRSQIKHSRRVADSLKGKTRADLSRELTAQGYIKLGRGCFAVTFYHPAAPDVVLKVGQQQSGRRRVKHLRDNFPAYVDHLLTTGTRSKFALRVYQHNHVSGFNGGTYVTVAERCYPGHGTKAQTQVSRSGYIAKGYDWIAKEPHNKAALRFLRPLRNLGNLDLHCGNVMVRKDGTPVITDPLV